MKILLTGADGQVGYELWRALQFNREVIPTTSDGRDVDGMTTIKLDLSDSADLEKKLENINADVICNAAAYTQVDQAETDKELAFTVNSVAAEIMAKYAKAERALMVHYSTDYVFSGEGKIPWREADNTGPKGVYGESKLAGEQAIIASGCEHMMFRTAWVFAERKQNFLQTMLRLAKTKDELSVVNDQTGCPTWANTIALGTMLALNQPETGIYHLTSNGSTTWAGFARRIFSHAQRLGLLENKPEVKGITTEEYPTAATRPKNSVLDCQKFEGTFNVKLPHWQTALQLCMQRMKP
ncbi:dTDP-4-dehydrorhamnose reductase [Marinicella rhabdoformis]|uniref:dTDP-4-dehydrorhamnose reductase n=1 Tax=Marinicella rhabdoformis TaxID=2580566 RepID=UPI0012AEC184|nr:dTDP-4-dehydrorhamnose reductase [Marinicella rhabdoformis]